MSFGLGANNLSSLWDTKKYSIGLSLNIPIFSGWSVENRVQSAKVASLNKEIDVTDLERSIKKDIQKNYLDLQAAEKQIEVGKKTVVSAEESRKIISEKYSLGSGTLLDVLSANTDFTTAQTNLVNSQFTYAKLKAQIQYLIGVLDQKKID
jgi:Outer membrane protein